MVLEVQYHTKVSAFPAMRIGCISKANACSIKPGRLNVRYKNPHSQQTLPSRDPVGISITIKPTVTEKLHSALYPPTHHKPGVGAGERGKPSSNWDGIFHQPNGMGTSSQIHFISIMYCDTPRTFTSAV